ncbi:amino acid ABC transporter permease [Deinococcus metallilatus]|uniref:Amino acid ABC transporter permease n=2 Tax=Deinococcus TaxID=1298 RepID=A0AAJ5F6P6_9DEIO|nr:amino acid ABC transporter permease [Deinococcus metallilatus]MBB5295506.1 cystine transport system permease protein [Deinococcus metallilatus]QBY07979.1 amino acid ABC transporter permease [Deinococcus metallilatus]RXJ12872.1 amino acid ABC transporter permease [Deinococcus metallilatus]TLK27206.1 amino acid ABC transporter permease [Deinococcus metallilatus]GMA16184.1 amino acid ABC transporter permease [Deinococcus metallilatus]
MTAEQLQLILRSAWQALPTLLAAAPITLGYALAAMLLGLPLALLVALARLSGIRPLQWISGVYVSFIRGTPLLVQIFVVYYGLPSFGITLSPLVGGVLALTFNAAAYLSETMRAAILSVPRGQREAALSLGLTPGQTLRLVVLPQAARVALPSLGNTLIGLVKDTSLVSVITVVELLRSAQLVIARTFEPFGPYLAAALIYWLISSLLELVQRRLEVRLSRHG